MNKWLMLKLADDLAVLSEDLKKAAGEENQIEAAPQKEEEQKEEKAMRPLYRGRCTRGRCGYSWTRRH